MPAPSPVSESHPQAPRCARLTRISQTFQNDVVRGLPFDIYDKTDAAGIMFIRGIIQALRFRKLVSGIDWVHGTLSSWTRRK